MGGLGPGSPAKGQPFWDGPRVGSYQTGFSLRGGRHTVQVWGSVTPSMSGTPLNRIGPDPAGGSSVCGAVRERLSSWNHNDF